MGIKPAFHPLFAGILLFILLLPLQGCEVVEGIFKAGMWTGFLIIAAIAALIVWLFTRGRSK